ncbi:MAG TPA: hypothetical protein PKD45_09605 [Flavobacteriales bacterium]|nr:hypothetical protein [Flavobacteriales bacterium]
MLDAPKVPSAAQHKQLIRPRFLFLEVVSYDLAGNVEKFRKTVVLAHRL